MQPCRGSSRIEGIEALSEKPRDKAGENVTAPARRELRRGVRIDDRTPVRSGDDRIGAFKQQDGVALRSRRRALSSLSPLNSKRRANSPS